VKKLAGCWRSDSRICRCARLAPLTLVWQQRLRAGDRPATRRGPLPHPQLLAPATPRGGLQNRKRPASSRCLLTGASRIQAGKGASTARGQQLCGAPADADDPISQSSTTQLQPSFQQGQASLRRLRAIEAEAVNSRIRSMPRPLASVRGSLAWRRSWFGLRPDQPVLAALQLTAAPGQSSPWWGAVGAGKKHPLFPVAAPSTTAQRRSGAARGQEHGRPARRLICAVPSALVQAHAELRVLPERWLEAIRFGPVQPASEQVRQASRCLAICPLTSSKPSCRWATRARIEERAAIFSGGSTCNGWRCPGRARQPQRPCCCSMRPNQRPSMLNPSRRCNGPGASDAWSHRAGDCPIALRHRAGSSQISVLEATVASLRQAATTRLNGPATCRYVNSAIDS